MIQEEKRLLLIDLCARLPYDNTIVHIEVLDENHAIIRKTQDDKLCLMWVGIVAADNPYHMIKPYLRPMLSMTEEELTECENMCDSFRGEEFYELIDWLNAHHFDYRGLIKKGLALEAPEGMYN